MLKFTQRGVLAPEAFWAMQSVMAQRPLGSWHAFLPLLIRGVPHCHPLHSASCPPARRHVLLALLPSCVPGGQRGLERCQVTPHTHTLAPSLPASQWTSPGLGMKELLFPRCAYPFSLGFRALRGRQRGPGSACCLPPAGTLACSVPPRGCFPCEVLSPY